MEPIRLDTEHLIARYLAGQLSANDSDAFEQAVSERPDLRDRTEQALRLKEGLARLRERGELDALLQPPAPRRWLPYAAAAAAVVVALGIFLRLYDAPAVARLAGSPAEFATRQPERSAILGTYVLARTRGAAAATDVGGGRTAGAIELRAVPSVWSPGGYYSLRLRRLDGPGRGTIVGRIERLSAGPDGYVTSYLNSAELQHGEYELSLAASPADPASPEADRFIIRVH